MTILHAIILIAAGFAASAINSVAGGGSFISFPTLIFTGLPSVTANATNSVALWPGLVASTLAYVRELRSQGLKSILALTLVSAIGGVIGAIILLHTPGSTFDKLIPYLLLTATVVFTFGAKITGFSSLHKLNAAAEKPVWFLFVLAILQLVISVYGGFFGGGMGFMVLALLSATGMTRIHLMNSIKALLTSVING
ncbi:MAG: sulfite exporter TauE/SafE family protein, partial [Pyrinomonadaceae bacterium]